MLKLTDVKELQEEILALKTDVHNLENRLARLTELFTIITCTSLQKVSPTKTQYVPEGITHYMFRELYLKEDTANLIYEKLNNCKQDIDN